MTPYQEALQWIEEHSGTGSAGSLARLLLSLWNDECSYSFRECISNLDDNLSALAVRTVVYFAEHGEDEDLVGVGHKVCRLYPRAWDAGQAMQRARTDLQDQWQQEDRREAERLCPNG